MWYNKTINVCFRSLSSSKGAEMAGLDVAVMFFLGTSVVCAAFLSVFTVGMYRQLAADGAQQADDAMRAVEGQTPLPVLLFWLRVMGAPVVVLTSLAFGGVAYVAVIAVHWVSEEAPWLFGVMAGVVLLLIGLDDRRERSTSA